MSNISKMRIRRVLEAVGYEYTEPNVMYFKYNSKLFSVAPSYLLKLDGNMIFDVCKLASIVYIPTDIDRAFKFIEGTVYNLPNGELEYVIKEKHHKDDKRLKGLCSSTLLKSARSKNEQLELENSAEKDYEHFLIYGDQKEYADVYKNFIGAPN